jgi:ATP-dependent Clp protease, protease subunit
LTGVLHSRRVPLRGPITERTAACCINRMLILAADNRRQPIVIDVDSPGGSVKHALAIIRTMNGVACPVATFSQGKVEGSALLVAAHGIKGFRVAQPNTRFRISAGMIHDVHDNNGEGAVFRHAMIQVLSHDTGRPEAEVSNWLDKGIDFGSNDAESGGVVDCVGRKPLFPASLQG